MTLEQIKKKTLTLIEEISPTNPYLTEDIDIQAKINHVINMIQYEIARIKKIPTYKEIDAVAEESVLITDIDPKIYQINVIRDVDAEIVGDRILFMETGIAKIYYYVYPEEITEATPDTYVFSLTPDVLEIMPYGIAADLLKSDVSANYGGIYADRYERMLSRLDPRQHTGSISFVSGDLGWQ